MLTTAREQTPTAPPQALVPLAGALLLLAFVGTYLAAFKSPAPSRVEVAVVAAPAQIEELEARLAEGRRDAFRLRSHGAAADARRALLEREVEAALVLSGETPPQLIVASAASAPVASAVESAFRQIASGLGTPLRVEDARPLPEHDSRGLALFFLAVGTTLASLVVGVGLHAAGRASPARQTAAMLGVWAVLAGLTGVATAGWLTGAIEGSTSAVAVLVGLLALAVAATVNAAARVLGPAGIALAALVIVVLGVSASGGAVGSPLQPIFFQALSEALPTGAALSALRGAVYFDGAGTLLPTLVLAAWAGVGLALTAVHKMDWNRKPGGSLHEGLRGRFLASTRRT